MALLNLTKIRITLQVQIPPHFLERHLPASPSSVGAALAQQVDTYQQEQQLGYYPALEFFQRMQAQGDSIHPVEVDALDTAHNIAWLAGNSVREEIMLHLRDVFSYLEFESLQCLAFTMPSVRPQHAEAHKHLSAHYTPIVFRCSVMVSEFYKLKEASQKALLEQDMEGAARKKVLRHLAPIFASVAITSATRV